MNPDAEHKLKLGILFGLPGVIAAMTPEREPQPTVNPRGMTGKVYRRRKSRAKMARVSKKRNR